MSSWSEHIQRPETPAEQRLYAHLLEQVKALHPREAIDLFRQLLLEGRGYPYPSIQEDLDWILESSFINHEFRFILNRSCYIFINSWFATGSHRVYIPELIETFESIPASTPYTSTEQKLRRLLNSFIESPQHRALRCLALTIRSDWDQPEKKDDSVPLESIIQRYPYIYRHTLLTRDSSFDQRRTVRAMQREAQRQFDVSLSRYKAQLQFGGVSLPRIPRVPAENPTLLSTKQLNAALHQYSGKIDGVNTHRDLAQQFLTYSQWTHSYRDFKCDLYNYLTPSVHSRFGKHHFNQRLASCLKETLECQDSSPLSDVLVQETCKKLLNFLVIESPRRPDHTNFIDLIANLGSTLTIAILLKIVLLCHHAKPWLERRFSVLFSHYSDRPKDDVIWLVEALENTNIALSTNFSLTPHT